MDKFKLSAVERESPLWKRLEAYYVQRLEGYRRRNDTDLPDGETAKLRGRIGEIKHLLALADETPDPVQESTGFPV